MAFYFVNDGVVDVAVAFEDGSEYARQVWFLRVAASSDQSEYTQGSTPNISAGVASVYTTWSATVDVTAQYPQPWGYGEYELNAPWFDPNDVAAALSNISGTDGLTFGQSGTLNGLGALAGTAALTFGQTGTATATGALAGSAAVTFGQSGAIGGLGALSGSSAIQFGQSGTLDQPSGQIAGTAAITFAQSAALAGFGSLSGNATATFGQSGALAGQGALNGSADLVFGQSGNLTALSGDISGSATIIFGASGTLDQPASAARPDGDGFIKHRGVKPIVQVRPKAERDLDEAMEHIEAVSEGNRVTENKKSIKQALAIVKAVDVAEIYKPALAEIKKAITKVSRHAAKHEGLIAETERIASEIDSLVAAMEARRKRQRREEEEILIWLANTTSKRLLQHA